MNSPIFRQRCKVFAIAKKVRKEMDGKLITQYERRIMAPKEGIYIGYRNVHEGETETIHKKESPWIGNDKNSHRLFTHTLSRVVWVFVFNEKEKPVYVFPEDVKGESK